MDNGSKLGVSAITAATMIAARPTQNQNVQDTESTRLDSSPRRLSLKNLVRDKTYTPESTDGDENKISNAERIQNEIDIEQNKRESLKNIITALASVYASVLVSVYIAFSFTELVTFPLMYRWLDIHGFFIYLYLPSIIYFCYLVLYVLKDGNKPQRRTTLKVVENIAV